jgi:hypothetical protein
MPGRRWKRVWGWIVASAGWLALAAPAGVRAQGTSGPTVESSSVGYIDPAIPGSQVRVRADAAYRNRRPTRAEFFYPKGGGAGGPGTPFPETSIDYQDFATYLEMGVSPRLSIFAEGMGRLLNPDINDNTAGFGDLNAGFKYAFLLTDDTVATFQLRTYIATGDADRGLGTNHASLEPAFLIYRRLTDRLTLEGEFRDWIPIGGTDFAGNVLRYGVGVSYGERCLDSWWLTPVAEVVGWTVLDGKVLAVPSPTVTRVEDAAGDTIVNVKLGLRLGFGDRANLYSGYGRALTGDTWYKDIWRVELRLLF